MNHLMALEIIQSKRDVLYYGGNALVWLIEKTKQMEWFFYSKVENLKLDKKKKMLQAQVEVITLADRVHFNKFSASDLKY